MSAQALKRLDMRNFLKLAVWFVTLGLMASSLSTLAGPVASDQLLENFDTSGEGPQTPLQQDINEVILDLSSQRYDQAISKLKPLTDQYPAEVNVWYLLTIAHYGQNQLDEALVAADRCLKIDPKLQAGYWLRGIVLALQTKYSDALRAYDQAIQVVPTRPAGYVQRGQFLVMYRSEDAAALTAAIEDLNKSLQLGAPPEMAHGFLGLDTRG